jgi:phage tail-like protein
MPAINTKRDEAFTVSRFSLTVDGVEIGQFSELAGITSEVESAQANGTRRRPPTVTLKRGKNKDMGIFAWHESVVAGLPVEARKSCSLTMYAPDGTASARYHLESAWPSKVEISALKAGASEILYETVTLTCDHIKRVSP